MNRRCFLFGLSAAARGDSAARASGYQGIWYGNEPRKDRYRYKSSGGFAT